ncbi:hypothetical protein ULF88_01365 [Halopseudomonas pachastrellae]|nr:hypothetical protein [Halopseudomonas pachastrellae]
MVIQRKGNAAAVSMSPLHELDKALELLHFGFRGLTVEADRYLAQLGLSRVHHRVLYVIAAQRTLRWERLLTPWASASRRCTGR